MSEKKILDKKGVNFTPHYQMKTEGYGGAAAMKMILESHKVGWPRGQFDQENLFQTATDDEHKDLKEPNDLWYIDPIGMMRTLNEEKPDDFETYFEIVHDEYENKWHQNALLRHTILGYDVAPAVLIVNGGRRWIVVVGYELSDDNSLQCVYIHDTWPPDNTDLTGREAFHFVSAEDWNNEWLKTVSPLSERWADEYVMVRDPDQPVGELRAAKQVPLADGRQIISPDQALEFAQEVIEERDFFQHDLFADAVREGKPATPQLVQMTHRHDQFYYLVRYRIKRRDAAIVAINARFGTLMEAIAYTQPTRAFRVTPREIPRLLAEGLNLQLRIEDVRDRIIDQLYEQADFKRQGLVPGMEVQQLRHMLDSELARLRQPAGRQVFRPQEISVHDTMVWQPSAQSMSMFYPSFLVNTPTQRIFVRANDAMVYFDTEILPIELLRLGG